MVEIEGELRSTAGNLLAILHQFLNATYLGEGRCHRTDAESTNRLSMLGQVARTANTRATNMYDDLKVFEILGSSHPSFGNLFALILCKHVALATGAIDKYAFKTIPLQECGIFRDNKQVDAAIGIHRSEWGVNKTFDFFHNYMS